MIWIIRLWFSPFDLWPIKFHYSIFVVLLGTIPLHVYHPLVFIIHKTFYPQMFDYNLLLCRVKQQQMSFRYIRFHSVADKHNNVECIVWFNETILKCRIVPHYGDNSTLESRLIVCFLHVMLVAIK